MCGAIVDVKTAGEITERVEQRRKSIRESIESYRRYIQAHEARLREVEGQILRLFAVKARLEAAGFRPEVDSWSDTLALAVAEDRMKALYDVVGRLDGEHKTVDLVNARKKLVRVTMTAVDFPFLSVSFETKLPGGAECRIEKLRTKARTESRLVCSNG